MTEPIVLKIVTDSTDAVTGIVDVKKATEALRAELKKLDEQLKNLGRFDAKEKTDLQVKYNGITKAITELEKPLDDATKKQNALNESQKKGATGTAALGKSFTDFAKKAGLVAAALGILTKIGQALIQTFKDTAAGMGLVVRAQTIWKQQIYDLVQGNIKQGASIKELNDWSTKKIALQLRENDVLVTNSKLQNEYDKLLVESAKAGKSAAEKLELLNKAEEKKNLIDENNINMMKQNLELLKEDIKRRPELLSLKQQEAQLTAAINIAEGQKSLRLQQKQTAAWDQMWNDYKAWIEKMTDAQDEFQSLSLKLLEDYEKTQIDLLEGNDKIAAQRDYDLKQLDEFRKQMQRLGKLTAEQEKQFAILGAGIWMAFYEGLTKEAQKALPQKDIDAISKVLLPELAGIQAPVVNTAKNIADKLAGYKANEEFSFWNLLGLKS